MNTGKLPNNASAIMPFLTVKDIDAALSFYEKAFGFKKDFAMPGPGGKTVHAQMQHGNCFFMLGAESPTCGLGRSVPRRQDDAFWPVPVRGERGHLLRQRDAARRHGEGRPEGPVLGRPHLRPGGSVRPPLDVRHARPRGVPGGDEQGDGRDDGRARVRIAQEWPVPLGAGHFSFEKNFSEKRKKPRCSARGWGVDYPDQAETRFFLAGGPPWGTGCAACPRLTTVETRLGPCDVFCTAVAFAAEHRKKVLLSPPGRHAPGGQSPPGRALQRAVNTGPRRGL